MKENFLVMPISKDVGQIIKSGQTAFSETKEIQLKPLR